MSGMPSWRTVSATRNSRSSGLARLWAMAKAGPPAARIWSAVSPMVPANGESPGSVVRAATVTAAPSAANRLAISAPMPRLAPVTIAIFPSSRPTAGSLWIGTADARGRGAESNSRTGFWRRDARPVFAARRSQPGRGLAPGGFSADNTDEAYSGGNHDPGERAMSVGSFERYPLLFGPSPVHRLERLSAQLGGARVWAKREDCNSGIAYGGNKTRKLEYLVADALANGCDTLVSIGGVQSNHTRQVAAVAARAGLACVLIQESWVNWPDSVYDKVGNILISRLAGADVRLVRAEFGIGFKDSWEQGLQGGEAAGGGAAAVPAGASDHPLGGLGFASWAYELAAQERQLGVFFDTIVVCSVTGSTQAGMVAGFAALSGTDVG